MDNFVNCDRMKPRNYLGCFDVSNSDSGHAMALMQVLGEDFLPHDFNISHPESFLCQLIFLLVDNFLHADMHPGNILVRVSQGKTLAKSLFKSRPHVIFLDVGMTAELSKKDRNNLLEFFKAVALQDGRTAAEYTLRSTFGKCRASSTFSNVELLSIC
ncbi:Protein kinase superfamily protein [Abeliophyllum distichum]|uniref:Protein kinase superfamily protein n=1 Tax=Abeliophyllum distichum TaxID=126358 RepID=A0ABD1Q2Y5_9LAMI